MEKHLNDWSESDGIVKEISLIETSNRVQVREFRNYLEDDESDAINTLNDVNESRLLGKYRYVCFYDLEFQETRRIVGVEWHRSTVRGACSCYQVVTQVTKDDNNWGGGEGLEAYAINEVLYEMITHCPPPHNDCFNIIVN